MGKNLNQAAKEATKDKVAVAATLRQVDLDAVRDFEAEHGGMSSLPPRPNSWPDRTRDEPQKGSGRK